MELSKKRSRNFGIGNAFTAEEMEAADALLRLCHSDCFFVQWGVKRRRSAMARGGFSDTRIPYQAKLANRSPSTPLGISWSESDEFDERAGGLPPSSKDTNAKNVCRRRLPKKKTHKELKEMVNSLSVEKSRLKKEEEQLLKTYQELQKRNHHLKSQLAARLTQRQEQKPLSTSQLTSSDGVSSHGTETFACVDDLSKHNEHNQSDHFVGTLSTVYEEPLKPLSTSQPTSCDEVSSHGTKIFACVDDLSKLNEHNSSDHFVGTLSTVYEEPLHVGVSVYQPELESPSGFENGDSSRPTKDPSGLLSISDLNALTEAMCDMVPNGFHEEMLLSKNKVVVAAEARRRRIELTRAKYAQMRKVRSR